jgi:hypothetical protein
MKKEYAAPVIRELGSLQQLTQAQNKIGHATDIFTALSQGAIVGSLTGII